MINIIDFPNDIMIEITNNCNLKCITCYSHQDNREKKYMSLDIFKKIIDEIPNKELKTISLYNYGEPLMHSDIGKMVEYAKNNKIKNIKIATNGIFLTLKKSFELIKGGLDYLSISIDGTTQEIYEKFRIGGNLNIILKNIQNIVKLKEKIGYGPVIEIQFIIMSHNENQIKNIETLAKKLKVDILRYKTILIKENKWKYLLPKNEKYSRYKDKKLDYCNKPQEGIVINVDGKVIPCCYITDKYIDKFLFGNIINENLNNIFNKDINQKLIKQIGINKSLIEYCKNCNEGNLNLNYKIINLKG